MRGSAPRRETIAEVSLVKGKRIGPIPRSRLLVALVGPALLAQAGCFIKLETIMHFAPLRKGTLRTTFHFTVWFVDPDEKKREQGKRKSADFLENMKTVTTALTAQGARNVRFTREQGAFDAPFFNGHVTIQLDIPRGGSVNLYEALGQKKTDPNFLSAPSGIQNGSHNIVVEFPPYEEEPGKSGDDADFGRGMAMLILGNASSTTLVFDGAARPKSVVVDGGSEQKKLLMKQIGQSVYVSVPAMMFAMAAKKPFRITAHHHR